MNAVEEFLAKNASKMQHCERLNVTAMKLPCGQREECLPCMEARRNASKPKPAEGGTRGAAYLRKVVADSGLDLKAFCKKHGINEATLGQHMRGDMRISPYMLRQYESKLGIPREELEDAMTLNVLGISPRFW